MLVEPPRRAAGIIELSGAMRAAGGAVAGRFDGVIECGVSFFAATTEASVEGKVVGGARARWATIEDERRWSSNPARRCVLPDWGARQQMAHCCALLFSTCFLDDVLSSPAWSACTMVPPTASCGMMPRSTNSCRLREGIAPVADGNRRRQVPLLVGPSAVIATLSPKQRQP